MKDTRDPEYAARKWLSDCTADEADTVLDRLDELDAIRVENEQLRAFAEWLVSMDDSEDVLGREARRTVILTNIIDRARAALDAGPAADTTSGGEST